MSLHQTGLFIDTLDAHKENLTFYDASFIKTAENVGSILVTEDEKLKEATRKSVKTITYKALNLR